MHRTVSVLIAMFVLTLAGCLEHQPSEPSDDRVGIDRVAGTAAAGWQCGSTSSAEVALEVGDTTSLTNSQLQSTIDVVVGNFNAEVVDAPGLTTAESDKLWRLVADNTPSGADVVITVNENGGTGDGWCGTNGGSNPTTSIGISRCDTASESGGSPFPNRATTVLHETWDILLNTNIGELDNPNSEVTAGCSLHASNPIPETTRPCVPEVQFAFDYCGVRPISVDLTEPLLHAVEIEGPNELELETTGTYTATGFLTDNDVEQPDPEVTATVGDWNVPSFLDLVSGGNPATIEAVAVGSGILGVEVAGGASVAYPWPTDELFVDVPDPDPEPDTTIAYIVISPSSMVLTDDSWQTLYDDFDAQAYNAADEALPGKPYTWSIGNSSVATINSAGNVEGIATGFTSATVSSQGVSENAPVQVKCGKPNGTLCTQF